MGTPVDWRFQNFHQKPAPPRIFENGRKFSELQFLSAPPRVFENFRSTWWKSAKIGHLPRDMLWTNWSCSKSAENRFLDEKKSIFFDFFFSGGRRPAEKMLTKRAPPRVFVLPPVFLKIFHRLGENRRKSPTCLVTCYGRTEVAQNRLKIDFLTEKKSIFPKFFFSGGRRPVDRNPKTTTPLRPASRRS